MWKRRKPSGRCFLGKVTKMLRNKIFVVGVTIVIKRDDDICSQRIRFPEPIGTDPGILAGKYPFILAKIPFNILPAIVVDAPEPFCRRWYTLSLMILNDDQRTGGKRPAPKGKERQVSHRRDHYKDTHGNHYTTNLASKYRIMNGMTNTELRHFGELLWAMTEKELRARYKHTVFGFLWLIANPLLQMLIIGFVFPLFVKEPVKYYDYFLFTGLLAWNFFSLSLSKATPSIVYERSLIKKAVFPRAVIPISIILSNLINYVAAFILFLVPLLFLNTLTLMSAWYFLCGLITLVLFTIGTSLLTSALNVRYRDINFFVQAILIIWFYATPIVYALSQIPPRLLWLWRFNPLTSSIQFMQAAVVGSELPCPAMLASNMLITLAITILGILTFHRESKFFDDWL